MAHKFTSLALALSALSLCSCTVYFDEKFSSPNWADRWIQSEFSGKEFGKFDWTPGKFYGDEEDKGIQVCSLSFPVCAPLITLTFCLQTSQDARFYGLTAKFQDKAFSTDGKDLVLQFSVKHEQNIDCGGGYLKVFDCAVDEKQMHGETPYRIMFGPDICGPGTKKVHVIFNYKGKNLLINKDIRCKDDVYTHVYRLVVKPDNTYKVLIDGESVESGELEKDWSFLPPKKIKDPAASKPSDWDDREKIDDPEDTKPEDWEQPEFIPDPDATKPEDWDDEMDGDWEPPQINNPSYKGEWKPKQIPNPAYKGPWVHPEIDNPEYAPDDKLYLHEEICAVGLDLWQVKSGTIFDNILVSDSEEEADAEQTRILDLAKKEKKMKEEQDEEERKKLESEKKDDEAEDAEDGADEKVASDENEIDLDKDEEEEDDSKHDEL